MKHTNKYIHIVEHIPTGAMVPVVINKISTVETRNGTRNIIEDFESYIKNRKGFTVSMLQDRWDMAKDDVIELLQEYEVPGHLDGKKLRSLSPESLPVDIAIFFEEYIYGLEKKASLCHTKLKSRKLHEDIGIN